MLNFISHNKNISKIKMYNQNFATTKIRENSEKKRKGKDIFQLDFIEQKKQASKRRKLEDGTPLHQIFSEALELNININKWIQDVTVKNVENFVYPYVIHVPQMRASEDLTCKIDLDEKEPGFHVENLHEIIQNFTFVICDVTVRIKRPFQNVLAWDGNHATTAFLFRKTVSDPWHIAYCDPNYFRASTLGARIRDRRNLSLLAFRILEWADTGYLNQDYSEFSEEFMQKYINDDRIHIRTCVNVNKCYSHIAGICYIGICLTLMACAIFKETKVTNSIDLLNMILKTSEKARNAGDEFVNYIYILISNYVNEKNSNFRDIVFTDYPKHRLTTGTNSGDNSGGLLVDIKNEAIGITSLRRDRQSPVEERAFSKSPRRQSPVEERAFSKSPRRRSPVEERAFSKSRSARSPVKEEERESTKAPSPSAQKALPFWHRLAKKLEFLNFQKEPQKETEKKN